MGGSRVNVEGLLELGSPNCLTQLSPQVYTCPLTVKMNELK